ncbi:MAG: hypothetical protein ACFBSF_06025 [Leptolyngbyaceae cyanobacterium]
MRYVRFLQGISLSIVVALGTLGIFSQSSWAQPSELRIVINADAAPDFWQLIAEAEALLSARITQLFATDPTVTGVILEVLAERNGAIVPLMLTRVSRNGWQTDGQIASWTEYFDTAQVLLSYTSPVSSDVSASSQSTLSIEERRQQQIQLQDALD